MDLTKMIVNLAKFCLDYLYLIIIWTLAFFFLIAFQVDGIEYSLFGKRIAFTDLILTGTFSAIIWGSILKLINLIRKNIKVYFLVVLLSFIANVLTAEVLFYSIYYFSHFFTFADYAQSFSTLAELYQSQLFYATLIYFFVVGSLIEIFHNISKRMGKGVLLKFLLGKYFRPKEEERIFLFMDLKSSTHYAEQLGHFKYSRLIQDCFRAISYPALKNHAQIYQFVGDEIVLTWKLKEGVEQNRCIQLYYDFVEELNKKQEYYQREYGMLPIFKAGIHCGKVMVAEVGELKSEIAYHGDAINTASRIQGLCNQLGERFLLSNDIVLKSDQLSKSFQLSSLGVQFLNGREIPIEIYGIKKREC